jgi:hypothetical protein
MALSLNSPYEIESEEEDYCSYDRYNDPEPWPHPFACRGYPDIAGMIRFSYQAPKPPQPVPEFILKIAEENKKIKASATTALAAADSVLKKVSGELKVAEDEVKKSYVWSNRSGKQQLIDRLKKEMASAVQARAEVAKKLDEITKKSKDAEDIIQMREQLQQIYEQHEELMAGLK